jgi:hypothetical protein
MRVTSNQYSDAVSNMVKRKIYSDLSMELTNEMVCYIAHCIRIMIILIDKESQLHWLIGIKRPASNFSAFSGREHLKM